MWTFFHRAWRYFSIGFIVGLIVALFILVDGDKLMLAIAIGALVGVALTASIFLLERRFPDDPRAAE